MLISYLLHLFEYSYIKISLHIEQFSQFFFRLKSRCLIQIQVHLILFSLINQLRDKMCELIYYIFNILMDLLFLNNQMSLLQSQRYRRFQINLSILLLYNIRAILWHFCVWIQIKNKRIRLNEYSVIILQINYHNN